MVESSGNVFADIGLPDAADLSMKAELTRQLCNRIKALGLTQTQARERLGLSQVEVLRLLAGRHTGLPAERLMDLLTSLEVDVDIILRFQSEHPGHRGTIRVMEASK